MQTETSATFSLIKSQRTLFMVKNTLVIFLQFSDFSNVAPYDIALIKLEKPLKLNKNVKAIDLPKQNSSVEGKVVLSGWGSIQSSGFGTPNNLQKVTLPIVDLETCRESIEALTGSAPLAPSNVCTGPLTGGVSACSVSLNK